MAFLKFANAPVVTPAISLDGWDEVRARALALGTPFDVKTAAAKKVLEKYDPKQYLLSHCTIVASVDTENGPGPLGRQVVGGMEIDRRYPDYYITPETSGWINSNFDSWSRPLLLSTFRTFIGAPSHIEHIQIPELAKGIIIDAAARDIGKSVYIDILVANDRKHKALIEAITSKRLSTLSMGCFVAGTQVTLKDGTHTSIEYIQPGDMVLTHKGRVREVTSKQIRIGSWDMRQVVVGGRTITSTSNHPFLVLNGTPVSVSDHNTLIVNAAELRVGDMLFYPRGSNDLSVSPIEAITPLTFEGPVFDLEVEEDHSYVVEGVAVHNCTVQFTICSKCGNVAEDETNLCGDIRFSKGQDFKDANGKTRKVAEICGHLNAEPGSNRFIEASWVENPAFKGAVVRQILTPEEAALVGPQVLTAFSMPSRAIDPNAMQRAAKILQPISKTSQEQQNPSDLGHSQGPAAQPDPFEDAINEMAGLIKEKALAKVRGELADKEIPRADLQVNQNNTLLREAVVKDPTWRKIAGIVLKASNNNQARAKKVLLGLMLYRRDGWKAIQASKKFTGPEILRLSRFVGAMLGTAKVAGESKISKTIEAVGGMAIYQDLDSFMSACRRAMGREVMASEKDALVALGRLFDLGSTT